MTAIDRIDRKSAVMTAVMTATASAVAVTAVMTAVRSLWTGLGRAINVARANIRPFLPEITGQVEI